MQKPVELRKNTITKKKLFHKVWHWNKTFDTKKEIRKYCQPKNPKHVIELKINPQKYNKISSYAYNRYILYFIINRNKYMNYKFSRKKKVS